MLKFKMTLAALAITGLAFAAEVNPAAGNSGPQGAVSAAPNTTVTTTTAVPAASGVIGAVDFRPTYKTTNGVFTTENYAQLGYRFNGGNTLTFRQEFLTNLYDPQLSPGVNAQVLDGSFRLKLNNLLTNQSGLALSLEPRLYLPTNAIKRDNGFITAARTYVKLKQSFSPTSYIQLSDSPILHVYSKDGSTVAGKVVQNPDVENRLLLEVEFEVLVKGLSLYIPLELASQHVRGFAGTTGTWGHKLGLWPELTYPVAKQVRLGVAYRSENLIKGDLSNTSFDTAFRNGVPQMILNASL